MRKITGRNEFMPFPELLMKSNYKYVVPSVSFQTFFVQAFTIVVDS